MNTRSVKFDLKEYTGPNELDAEGRLLLREAEFAMASSHSPYSHFKVGAAVLLSNGEIVKGSNQENAAYPSGLCAERVALFMAGSNYPGVAVKAIAVFVSSAIHDADGPAAPCGACRQVMAEYRSMSEQPMRILMGRKEAAIYEVNDIEALLPLMFTSKDLKKKQ